MVFTFGSVEQNFKCRTLSGGKSFIYWTDDEAKLLRREVNGTIKKSIEVVADQISIREFATNDEVVVWADFSGELKVAPIVQGKLSTATETLEAAFKGENLVLDGSYLYWREAGSLLRRVLEKDTFSTVVEKLPGYWQDMSFAINEGNILYVERGDHLYLRRLPSGLEGGFFELISDSWKSQKFTTIEDTVYWLEPDGQLRRAKRLAKPSREDQSIHYTENSIAWDWWHENEGLIGVDIVTLDGRDFHARDMYSTRNSGSWEPKQKDWEWRVRWRWWTLIDYRISGYFAISDPVSVDSGRRFTRLSANSQKYYIEISTQPF